MIYDIYPMNSYSGNGSATTFGFDFYIENKDQLNVFLYDTQGGKFLLSYGIDYSVNEFKNSNGSYITFPLQSSSYGVLAVGERISLELTLPISQENEYNNSSLLNLEALEYSFDYVTRLIQILSKRINSCLEIGDFTSSNITQLIQQVLNCASLAQTAYDNIVNYRYNKATQSSLGVVKIGSGVNVDSDGVISVNGFCDKSISNLTDLGNARLQYAPFAINSGNVDNNGENNTLTFSGSTLSCAPCTITTPDGRTLVDTETRTYDTTNLGTGTPYVFKNVNNGAVSVLWGIVFSKTAPLNPVNYGGWVDISKFPATFQYYNGSSWVSNNNLVYIGKITLSTGTITAVENRKFNDSGYMIERYPEAVIVETYSNGDDWYRIYSDGWCEQGGKYDSAVSTESGVDVSLIKPYASSSSYRVLITMIYNGSGSGSNLPSYMACVDTASKFVLYNDGYTAASAGAYWVAYGYLT